MSSSKITDGVYSVGVQNPALRVFDIVMTTDYGTTYNSFLVKGREKTALIETCHKTFYPFYLNNIREICALDEIDYIILNHCEPDHSGSLAELSKLMPNAAILASQAGGIYLKNITNLPSLKIQTVKQGESVDLGGKTLQFISAPFLHWPDSMFTWLPEDQVLFSCDFFGCHYCEPNLFDYNVVYPEKYEDAFAYYYNGIFGPFKPYVLSGLEKIKDLDISFVCTSHGPVLTRDGRLSYAKQRYSQWSQPAVNDRTTIPLFYTSAYGCTRNIAKAIQKGILSVLPDAVVECYDLGDQPVEKMQALLMRSDAFCIGSPTINKDAVPPVWSLLSHVDAVNCQKKPVLAFGSYGWSGEGVPNMIARLSSLKMKVYEEGLKIPFVPSETELQTAEETGKSFARSL